jgi:hypothetical protein
MMGCHQDKDVLFDDQRTNVFRLWHPASLYLLHPWSRPYLMIKVIFNAVDILVTGGLFGLRFWAVAKR